MLYHQFQETDTSTSHQSPQRAEYKTQISTLEPRFFFVFFGLGKTQIQNTEKSQTIPQKPLYLKLLSKSPTEEIMYRKKNLGGGHDIKRDQIKISHPLLLHRQLLTLLPNVTPPPAAPCHHEYSCDSSTRSSSVTDDEKIKLLQQQVPITDMFTDSRIVEPP